MAKRPKKVDVQRFGGTESVGSFKEVGNTEKFKNELFGSESEHTNVPWEAQSIETQSETKLEDDVGHGGAAIIRCFEFGINPEAFAQHKPTKQELFNSHYKGIEVALWKDGMKVMPEVNPRIFINQMTYQIFVGAIPMKGHLLHERPQTLAELARN